MSNRSKVGKDFIKKDKEKAELKAKAKDRQKNKKMSPPSMKELSDKARDIVSKEKGKPTRRKPNFSKEVSDKLNRGEKNVFSGFKISKMLDDKMGHIGQKELSEDKTGNLLYRRKKLFKDVKKAGEAKQVPKSMNMGGVMKARGGTFKGTY
jgi:hypothetical protein